MQCTCYGDGQTLSSLSPSRSRPSCSARPPLAIFVTNILWKERGGRVRERGRGRGERGERDGEGEGADIHVHVHVNNISIHDSTCTI